MPFASSWSCKQPAAFSFWPRPRKRLQRGERKSWNMDQAAATNSPSPSLESMTTLDGGRICSLSALTIPRWPTSKSIGGGKVMNVFPERVPDLFIDRPVILTGRMGDPAGTTIRVTGRVGDQVHKILLSVDPIEESVSHRGIVSVWARMKIADLYDRSVREPNAGLPEQIKAVALEYRLV